MTEKQTKKALEGSTRKAEKMLNDKDNLAKFMDNLEKSMGQYAKIGEAIEDIKLMIDLMKRFIKKEYTQIPLASIASILGALIYLVNPLDLIPDTLPVIGQVDDLAVIALCLKICSVDIDNYKKWLAEQEATQASEEQAETPEEA